jgi:ABC-type antimicrobial peptide transport system permease subunit
MARQLLTESLVVALAAAAVAVPMVRSVGEMLPAFLPVSVVVSLTPDLRVYLILAAVGVAAGLLFGAAPAWSLARRDTSRTLREGGTTGGPARTSLRDALVVAQLSISLGLVSGAALLGQSVLNAQRTDPGFDPDGLLVGFINLYATGRYELHEMAAFQERLLREMETVTGVTELREGLARSLSETRLFGTVVAVFAGLAMVLSLLGLYGLVSYGVAQRSRELGIRLALGAGGPTLVRMVLARAVRLAALGLVLGIGASLGVGRGLEGVLFGVEPTNPWALGTASTVLFLSAMLAAWAPARRASRVDAAVSLRS